MPETAHRTLLIWTSLVLLSAGACESIESEPSALRADPVFDWLAERYDRDGDGRLDASEFEASGRPFERFDRDGDGFITRTDFERAGLRVRPLRDEDARVARGLHLIARYFQADASPG